MRMGGSGSMKPMVHCEEPINDYIQEAVSMYIDRIFQDYTGTVSDWEGAQFSCVKSINDTIDNDVILLWMYDQWAQCWYRVFIDGAYCGIDRYQHDESANDLDESVACVDHSVWFRGKVLQNADVIPTDKADEYILLSMQFEETTCLLVCKSSDGDCELRFIDHRTS